MEQKLFLAACVMYAFSWISKRLFRKNKLDKPVLFGLWHASFLLLILGCAYSIVSFIRNSGELAVFSEQIISGKTIIAWLVILFLSVCGFFVAQKKQVSQRQGLIKTDMEWANTVYFAGFVASIIMFFFIQAFKIPSASMYNTLQKEDHLFVNKAVYGFRIPFTQVRFGQFSDIKKGDVVVFSFPAEKKDQINCGGYQYGRDYVKRIVALPGDKVEVKRGVLFVNDQEEPLYGYELFENISRLEPQILVTDAPKEENQDILVISPAVYQALWEGRKLEEELGLYLRDNFGPVVVPEGTYFAMGDNRDNSCDSRFWGPVPRQNIKGKAWFIHWPIKRICLIK